MATSRTTLGVVGVISGLLVAVFSRQPESTPAQQGAETRAGVLAGICEASAVIEHEGALLVGDNEGEEALYRFSRALTPLPDLPLTAPVEDIEAVGVLPDGRIFVVGSQGANKEGERRPGREQLLVQGAAPVRPDLSACAPCEAARGLPPKEGGLSVEGAAWFGDALWLGLRSPLDGGQAMLLRMEGDPTQSLRVAEVVRVDLGGFGVRDMSVVDGALWVLAGPPDSTRTAHTVYRWGGQGSAPERLDVELLPGAEGLLRESTGELLVVIDGDGKPGKLCKDPARWERVVAP